MQRCMSSWDRSDGILHDFFAPTSHQHKINGNAASILNPLKGNEEGNISVGFHFRSITKRSSAVGL